MIEYFVEIENSDLQLVATGGLFSKYKASDRIVGVNIEKGKLRITNVKTQETYTNTYAFCLTYDLNKRHFDTADNALLNVTITKTKQCDTFTMSYLFEYSDLKYQLVDLIDAWEGLSDKNLRKSTSELIKRLELFNLDTLINNSLHSGNYAYTEVIVKEHGDLIKKL